MIKAQISRIVIDEAKRGKITRVPGNAVFLTANPKITPAALLHNLKHNRILHEKNFMVTVVPREVPRVSEAHRLEYEPLEEGFSRVMIYYGFLEYPNVPATLARLKRMKIDLDPAQATYLLSTITLVKRATKELQPLGTK